jgi:Ras-related protein Rab-2A
VRQSTIVRSETIIPPKYHRALLFRPVTVLSRQSLLAGMAALPWDYIAKLVCIGDSGTGKSSLTIRLCEGRFSQHHDVTIGVEFGSRILPVGPPNTQTAPPKPSLSRDPSSAYLTAPDSALPSAGDTLPAGLPEPKLRPVAPPPTPPVQKHMKLSLWDTAGQETYKSVTRSYFRGASGALLVFDISRRATFTHVQDWLADLRAIAEPDIVVVLVGNKCDLAARATGGADGKGRREVTSDEARRWAQENGVLEYVETSAKSGEGVEMAFGRVAERIYQNIQRGKYDLNDRRSGVKGPGTGRQGGAGGVKLAPAVSSRGGCC